MDTRRIAVAAAILLLAGCRMDPNQMLLERELRLQEDEIYRLRGSLRDYQLALDSCRQENAALRQQLGLPETGAPGRPALTAPTYSLGSELVPTPEPPTPSLPSASLPPAGQAGPNARVHGTSSGGPVPGAGPTLADPLAPFAGRGEVASIATADSAQVAGITLLSGAIGGYDADGQPGDEGITVVVQPYDQQGRLLEAPADVTVVALDPAEVGDAARLARWDLPAELTSHLFSSIGNTRGMKLELPWPGDPPKHELVHVFVRYITRDGRSLKVDQQIRVSLTSKPTPELTGWTPRREAGPPGQTAGIQALRGSSSGSRLTGLPTAETSNTALSAPFWPGSPRLAQQPAKTAQTSPGARGTSQDQTADPGGHDSPRSSKLPSLPRPSWSPYRP